MTVTPSSPVVGIFRDRSLAEQAIDALYNAGFTSEQIRYAAPGTSGSILADLKSLFTGQNTSGGNIASDLTGMGLSDEEAQYYADEYKNGNTILAVSASSRGQEALNILHQYGAYNARTSDSSSQTTYSQQPSDPTQSAVYTPDETSSQQDSTPSWATQEQPSDAENHPFQKAQQDIVTSTPDTEAQNYPSDEDPTAQNAGRQPTEPLVPVYRSTSQDTSSPDAGTLEATPDSQATPSDPVASDTPFAAQATPSELTNPDATPAYQATASDAVVTDSTTQPQASQTDVATSDAVVTDSVAEPQATQTDVATSDAVVTDSIVEPQTSQTDAPVSDQTATDSTPASQSTPLATAPSEYEDELQQLQAQLQAAQQQLQDARAQLQAAKEHEAQVQTIRERERQLQGARQQLQDIQAQLQATVAELHETKERISQYP